ncbi:MAG: ThuA domain-containing protein [Planctomycetaceae bacterium]|nr:ThuA domain-containing protein [Planctomycetaceae bacterium]
MSKLTCRSSAVILILLLACASLPAAEPWADPKLMVKDGLELWLDASRATADKPPPAAGKLSQWYDASGRGRHLLQEAAERQPQFVKVGEAAVVRFDGLDDHLRAVKQAAELNSLTVFLVAAPRQNAGAFRGLVAFNKAGEKDYTSGLTIDLGPYGTPQFSTLNVEGRGFGGAQSLRKGDSPFGRLYTLEVASDAAAKTIKLAVDGQAEGERARDGSPLSMDEITLGARYYNNGAGEQHVDGWIRADIAEVLVYGRVLTADETKSVREYLAAKYAALKEALPPDSDGRSQPLVPVKDPPPVQVFAPGFSVRELPVDLTNINNVKYRPDGTLVALGYDGRVWLLRDTNRDGVEDQASLFWENKGGLRAPIGMDLTPPDYQHGEGVFVIGKSRLVLIVDTDRDGKGDKEIEVAGGWKESFQPVDGVGVAFDPRDGSVYFGHGTMNFTDPLLRDKEGRSHYSQTDETSAIIRVSPDFKTREVVAKGIRFPIAIRLNRHGDLFCTDQEGATWVPNGNPFDELLHVQKGRHYGFPPRHPVHLPGVIDEPSTFDFAPQHQSTCGFNFNEPVKEGGPIFGPAAWAGEAIVTGESRGKLYRTQLAKTPAGYVARTNLLAALGMLTIDACISTDGSLVVACHSGGPDWGSGPSGKGKLFKISYTDRGHPQPVLAWATGPREVRVEFDRPVSPELLKEVVNQSRLTSGRYARAGDRFETIWPGYAVVQMQRLAPRYDVPLRSAQLTPDGRTLVLAVDPSPAAVHYALMLPGMGRPPADKPTEGKLPQHAAIDLDFDLTGCEAVWNPTDGSAAWTGWLPHLDLQVAREMTVGSASHDALWKAMEQPGELVLRTQLDLTDMLRPAVQPGSQIDYELPRETVTVTLTSDAKVNLVAPKPGGDRDAFTLTPERNKTVPVELRLKKGSGAATLTAHWTTNEDNRPRPFPLRRMLVPWADTSGKSAEPTAPVRPPELAGGSWARGRKEFFGEQALCSKCHAIHGQGGTIGPDLSNLIHRDYASVLRDIATPSFAINPDHLSYAVRLDDGRALTGVVQNVAGKVRISDIKGNPTEVDPAEIVELKASPVSTMPEGLPKQVGAERLRDLMTFLLVPAPQMPRDYVGPRPKPRTVAEVNRVLAGAPSPPEATRPIRVVLVAGPKDHGPGEHDYPAWQKAWAELLAAGEKIEVATAWEWPAKEDFDKADVVIFYQHGDWNARRAVELDAFLARGGGAIYLHWAIDGRKLGADMAKRIGIAAAGAAGFRHGEITLDFSRDASHPIARNFGTLNMTDETYWKLTGSLPSDRLLASAVEEGQSHPQLWSLEHGKGRVFVSIPGHYSWTFDDPLFRVLLLRAIAWTAHEPVDRFNDLVWPGADVAR